MPNLDSAAEGFETFKLEQKKLEKKKNIYLNLLLRAATRHGSTPCSNGTNTDAEAAAVVVCITVTMKMHWTPTKSIPGTRKQKCEEGYLHAAAMQLKIKPFSNIKTISSRQALWFVHT